MIPVKSKSKMEKQNGKAKLLKALCDALETHVKIYLEVACGRVKVSPGRDPPSLPQLSLVAVSTKDAPDLNFSM